MTLDEYKEGYRTKGCGACFHYEAGTCYSNQLESKDAQNRVKQGGKGCSAYHLSEDLIDQWFAVNRS